jgi:hypothetical protein
MYSGKIAVPPGGGGIRSIMIQVDKETFKTRATNLRARLDSGVLLLTSQVLKIITKKK